MIVCGFLLIIIFSFSLVITDVVPVISTIRKKGTSLFCLIEYTRCPIDVVRYSFRRCHIFPLCPSLSIIHKRTN
jgi:hypothetical protein